MPNITGTTRAQSNFLRSLRDNPSLPADQWPTPFLFQKWLTRPAFRAAILSLRDAQRFRSAYALSRSAADASSILQSYLLNHPGYDLEPDQLTFLQTLLRLSQSATRLDPSAKPLLDQSTNLQSLTTMHPSTVPD